VLWPTHLSASSHDQLLSVFRRAGFGPPITMEGGLPSIRTVLGMIATGLAIAFVDSVLEQMSASAVVFHLEGRGAFAERGIIYPRADASPILASFLHEVRAAPRERTSSAAAASKTKRGRAARNGAAPSREFDGFVSAWAEP